MITPVNLTKHSITPTAQRRSNYAFWDDNVVTWDSADYFWDSPIIQISNLTKHTISPVNQVKN